MTLPGETGMPPAIELADGFSARTPWTAASAVLATLGIVLIAIGVAAGLGTVVFYASDHIWPRVADAPTRHLSHFNAMAAMVALQSVIVGLVWLLASWFGGQRREVLSLTRPVTRRLFLYGLAGMVLLLAPYNLASYALWPDEFTRDLRPFSELARSPGAWLAGLVVSIGAPFSEELLFRGFLLPALALATPQTFVAIALICLIAQMLMPVVGPLLVHVAVSTFPAGPAVFGLNLALLIVAGLVAARQARLADAAAPAAAGNADVAAAGQVGPLAFMLAAMFSTTAWTLMHVGYSLTGLAEVFMIGLYFCWLMWRTGNLWLTISLHAFYNGMQFLVLMLVPLPAPLPIPA